MNSARKFIGEAAHCLALARELRSRGHEVLLVLRTGFDPDARARAENLPVANLQMRGKSDLRSDFRDLKELGRIVANFRPDVIHCHRGKDHWLAAAFIALGRKRLPLVRTRHVVVPVRQHAFNRWLFLKRTQRVIAVSSQAAHSFGAMQAKFGERISTIYSAVDLVRFNPGKRSVEFRNKLGVSEGQPLVGLIARIQRIKGQRQFIDAAALVTREFPNAKFLLSGMGCDGKFTLLDQYAHAAGVRDSLVFMGWLDDVSRAIASLDVGVVASLGSEGSSRITYEYMASGVPVVATRVGGIPEIVEDGKTGLLVEPGNVGQLAGAILSVLRGPESARDRSSAALERVTAFHNYDRWVSDIVGVYNQAVDDLRQG